VNSILVAFPDRPVASMTLSGLPSGPPPSFSLETAVSRSQPTSLFLFFFVERDFCDRAPQRLSLPPPPFPGSPCPVEEVLNEDSRASILQAAR